MMLRILKKVLKKSHYLKTKRKEIIMVEKKLNLKERHCEYCSFFRSDYRQVTDKHNRLQPVNVCIYEQSIMGVRTLNYGSCFAVHKDGYCNYFKKK